MAELELTCPLCGFDLERMSGALPINNGDRTFQAHRCPQAHVWMVSNEQDSIMLVHAAE